MIGGISVATKGQTQFGDVILNDVLKMKAKTGEAEKNYVGML